MRILLFTTFFLLYSYCFGQTKHQKLIAAEYRIDSPRVGNFTYLVSYNFTDGILISKDTILGAETRKKGVPGSYVRYGLGKNFIYKNRYVISGIGNVIDIKTKSLVTEESGDFISGQGDTLIFHRSTGYQMFDLKTKKYSFINQYKTDKDKLKRSSPDNMHYLSIDQTKIPFQIWLHNSNDNKKMIVNDAGKGPNTMYSSQIPTIETHWMDNQSFLYAVHETKFNIAQKDYSKVTLRLFNINDNSDKMFFVLDTVSIGITNGMFFKDSIGQTIYRTSGWGYYLIDTVKKRLFEYPFYQLGFNFSTSTKSDQDGTIINFNNSQIGKLWCSSGVVCDGMIAVEYGDTGSNLGYPKGIKVWSHLTKAWTTINIPWLSKIIGWVDDD